MIENFRIKTECAVCPTKIWEPKASRLKKTKEYHEAKVRLSDLSIMTVGVCSVHLKLREGDLPEMTKKMHNGWLEEISLGIGNADWVRDKGLKLHIEGIVS